MVGVEEVLEVLEDTKKRTIERAKEAVKELKPGEVAYVGVSGWIKRNDDGYHVDIWRGFEITTMERLKKQIKENSHFLELYAKSLSPVKVLILLEAYEGASEGQISEAVGLRGGALHYHLRDLLYLGLLKKESRGKYRTTKYGSFVIRTALSAIRKFRESVRSSD